MKRFAAAHRRLVLALLAAGLCFGCVGCAGPWTSNPASRSETSGSADVLMPLLAGNQLSNPGLEEDLGQGPRSWGKMADQTWISFDIVDSPSHSGERSAHIGLSWQPGDQEKSVEVRGLVQEMSPTRFPTRLGGWFLVESWKNPSEQVDMYLQAVVMVNGDPRTRQLVDPDDPYSNPKLRNYQYRYYLGGITERPFEVENAGMKMIRPGPPPIGEWVYFELPILDDFESKWGVVPANYEFLRIFFELRWDNKEPGVGLSADVYYDDLFVGFEPWP